MNVRDLAGAVNDSPPAIDGIDAENHLDIGADLPGDLPPPLWRPPRWDAPRWLADFVRELRQFLLQHQPAALAGTLRYLDAHHRLRERVADWDARREAAFREALARPERLKNSPDRTSEGLVWDNHTLAPGVIIKSWVSAEWDLRNRPAVASVTIPPPRNRDWTLALDECWAGLMALHDKVRIESERIGLQGLNFAAIIAVGATDEDHRSLLFEVLCDDRVPQLTEADLPDLRRMLDTVRDCMSDAMEQYRLGWSEGAESIDGTDVKPPAPGPPPPPDGPEAGRRVWYEGQSVNVVGRTYTVIDFMWKREHATFEELKAAANEEAQDGTVHTWVNRANNKLSGLHLPWRLVSDGGTRFVRKDRC